MGDILDVKEVEDGKVKCKLALEQEEVLALQGNLKGICLLPLSNNLKTAEVVETGIHNSTKYFKIPSEISLRKNFGKRYNKQVFTTCQHHSLKNKELYIYVMQKYALLLFLILIYVMEE